MKKYQIVLVMFVLLHNVSFSQKFECFGGVNYNTFHHYSNSHLTSIYYPDYGYRFGVGIDSVKVDWLTMRFTINYENYGGMLDVREVWLSGGQTTNATVNKSILSLGIFPLNFLLWKRINVNFGMEISRLVNENFSGEANGWAIGNSGWEYRLNDKYEQYSSTYYFGFSTRLAYQFRIGQRFVVSPEYMLYYGLFNEFQEFPYITKSIRNTMGINVKRKISFKKSK